MWEFLSQNLRNKISVTDFFSRIWGMRETNTNSKLEFHSSSWLLFSSKRGKISGKSYPITTVDEGGVDVSYYTRYVRARISDMKGREPESSMNMNIQ